MGTFHVFWLRLKNNDLFKDSVWALIGSALGKGLSLFAGIAVARFLGKEIYGEYGMIKNTLLMIAVFSTFGLGYTATKFIAESKDRDSSIATAVHRISTYITLSSSGLIAVLLIIFAPFVSVWLEAPHLSGILRLSAVAVIFNAVNTTQIGELAGYNAYRKIAVNNVLAGIVTFILSILLTWLYNINGAVIALILSLFFNCLLNYVSLKRVQPESQAISIQSGLFRQILSFSFPIALQESLYSITHWGATFILIKTAGYGELGLSSAAGQWMAVLLFVPGALRNVALSHLSGSNADKNQNNKILKQLLLVNLVSTLIPFVVIALLRAWICSWYGPTYSGLQSVLNVSIFTTIVNSLTNVYTQELIAHNQNWYLFGSRLIRDCGILIACYIMIPIYSHGALVYASISLIGQGLYLVLLWYKYRHMSYVND